MKNKHKKNDIKTIKCNLIKNNFTKIPIKSFSKKIFHYNINKKCHLILIRKVFLYLFIVYLIIEF